MKQTRDFSHWQPRELPGQQSLAGQFCTLEPLDLKRDGEDLFLALQDETLWTYMTIGPFEGTSAFIAALAKVQANAGWITMAIKVEGQITGMVSYMRNRPEHGSTEIGGVMYGPALQRTRAGTETVYLMAQHAFDTLGYRRFEWKCDNANAASKRAALRYGFQFEGVFRNDMIVKGRSRDTAWFAMTDADWPLVKASFQRWLDPANFDREGAQISGLQAIRSDLSGKRA